ncbi:MAG: hypothetical protein NC041_09005 [Bacteroides sp.]|nr:hypothetical protein [Prevotella sp.]MCM1408809.1 hypothetical protein [Treponema brennaborense]MCM1470589.1 hypothetical protein [Bacteroides sp.]
MKMVYKSIQDELFQLHNNGHDASDFFSGATLNKVKDGGYHRTSYWKLEQDYFLASEAMANLISSSFTNLGSYNIIKRYFPKSEKIFSEMIKKMRKILESKENDQL